MVELTCKKPETTSDGPEQTVCVHTWVHLLFLSDSRSAVRRKELYSNRINHANLKTPLSWHQASVMQKSPGRAWTNLPYCGVKMNFGSSNSLSLCLSDALGEIRMAFVLYKHLGTYLSTENASMKFSSEALNTNYTVIVNSPIITAAINKDSNKVYLSDPVVFTVRHIQVSKPLSFHPTHLILVFLISNILKWLLISKWPK